MCLPACLSRPGFLFCFVWFGLLVVVFKQYHSTVKSDPVQRNYSLSHKETLSLTLSLSLSLPSPCLPSKQQSTDYFVSLFLVIYFNQ